MQNSVVAWCLLLVAFVAANIPFMNQSLFALFPLNKKTDYQKPFWIRLVEMIVLYFLIGIVAHQIEAYFSDAYPQTWQFYAVTGCLFLVFAYPGYVFRYLRKAKKA